ncbi:hypothetical protein ACFT9I_07945 [Streptomyces sp. NPDC057137]|uniref:hypothetical protein n=1 Tax=Streptomyces sp. NPDC057137 TaxID=3346030 RepID=UPI00362BAC5C
MMKTVRLWPVGCGIVMVLLVAGCSSEPPKREKGSIGWSTCNELFGAKNIDALEDQMGEGQLQIEDESYPVEDLTAALTSKARAWEPESFAHMGGESPCRISISDYGKRFTSEVRWTSFPVNGGNESYEWRGTAGDVTATVREGRRLELVFPCEVPGAHKQQEKDLPLGVSVWGKGMPKFDETLRQKTASAFARKLSAELGCVNKPDIPRDITVA